MSEAFPYGQNLATPDLWVGQMPAKSRRWMVSYDGSFSIVCGYHSFIFLGLDSLNIAVINLLNCGPSVGLPIGKLFKGAGAGARTADRIERAYETGEDVRQGGDAILSEADQAAAGTGLELYQRMTQAIPTMMEATIPISLKDLAGMAGSIAGAEIEIGGAAALYLIEGTDGMLGPLVFSKTVANAGDGLVSAGVGVGIGVWSVERWHNLYLELGTSALARCHIEGSSPTYDQPYRRIPNLHPYLSALPPIGCSFAETGFDPGAAFR